MQDDAAKTPAPRTESPPPQPATRAGLARPATAANTTAARVWLKPEEAAKTVRRLRELCRTKGDELQELETAAKALRDSGYKQELSEVLREAITWPESHPRVGALWVRRLVSSNNWDRTYPKGMDELCQRGEIGHCAVLEFLDSVSQKGRTHLVRQAVRKHAGWLAEHPVGWGVAARALARVRLYAMAARWMADWRKRQDMDLTLLYSLALALRGTGREREAHEVVQLALGKPNAEQQFPVLKLWLAEEEALTGDTEQAATHLKEKSPTGWDEDAVGLFYLTRGVIRVGRAESSQKREAFAAAYDRIRDQFRKHRVYQREMVIRRQYRRCVSRMARDSGAWLTGLAARWRSADDWVTIVLLVLLPGLQFFAPLFVYRFCRHRRGREK